MTAFASLDSQHLVAAPGALPHCPHSRMHFGLDRAYCPDCKQGFSPKTPQYKALLTEASTAMVAAALAKAEPDCRDSDATIDQLPGTPEREYEVSESSGGRPDSVLGDAFTSAQADASVPQNKLGVDSKHTPASGWIEKYTKRQQYEYYRYCWQPSHKEKPKRLHIPSDSGKLIAVRQAIGTGQSPAQIQQLIKSWVKSK